MGARRQIWLPISLVSAATILLAVCTAASAQVFVVGKATATEELKTDYTPTHIDLSEKPMNELGRRMMIRAFEAEQGFAHMALPIGTVLTLHANGDLKPGADQYRTLVYQKGTAALPGERVAITKLDFKSNELIFDLNGGPYLPHRFLRHVQIGDNNIVNPGNADQPTGARLTLVFDKFIPDVSPEEVKALIAGIIDFNEKTGVKDYADTLPPKIRDAVKAHEVLVGMDHEMVLKSMGEPTRKVREHDEAGKNYEEWIYGTPPSTVRFVRFMGNRVVIVKVASTGAPMIVRNTDETGGEVPAYDTRDVALGDSPNPDGSKPLPPSLRKPGEPEQEGSMRRVVFPTDKDGQATDPQQSKPPAGSTQSTMHTVEFPDARPADPNSTTGDDRPSTRLL